jgi:hypothetical protein
VVSVLLFLSCFRRSPVKEKFVCKVSLNPKHFICVGKQPEEEQDQEGEEVIHILWRGFPDVGWVQMCSCLILFLGYTYRKWNTVPLLFNLFLSAICDFFPLHFIKPKTQHNFECIFKWFTPVISKTRYNSLPTSFSS